MKKSQFKSNVIIIADEFQIGGLKKYENQADKAYAEINKNLKPNKIIALSATDYGADEDVFGVKNEQNTYRYPFTQSNKDGFTSDCEFVTIHTGLTQKLSNSKVLKNDSLKESTKNAKKEKVDLKHELSKDAFAKANINAAILTYIRDFVGKGPLKPAVFFVKDIKLAEYGVSEMCKALRYHFLDIGRKDSVGPNLVRSAHSKKQGFKEIVEDFRMGKFPLIFTVKLLQEGFDYPSLSVAFDTVPSFSNEARLTIQKMGRIIRKHETKTVAKYYMCMGLGNSKLKYDVSKAVKNAADNEEVQLHMNFKGGVMDQDHNGDASGVAISTSYKEESVGNKLGKHLKSYVKETGMPMIAKTVKSDLFVAKAKEHKKVYTVMLSKILVDSPNWSDIVKNSNDPDLWIKAMPKANK